MQPQTPERRLLLLAVFRKQIDPILFFPQHRMAGGEFDESELRLRLRPCRYSPKLQAAEPKNILQAKKAAKKFTV